MTDLTLTTAFFNFNSEEYETTKSCCFQQFKFSSVFCLMSIKIVNCLCYLNDTYFSDMLRGLTGSKYKLR